MGKQFAHPQNPFIYDACLKQSWLDAGREFMAVVMAWPPLASGIN
jgi:hypothetical protein